MCNNSTLLAQHSTTDASSMDSNTHLAAGLQRRTAACPSWARAAQDLALSLARLVRAGRWVSSFLAGLVHTLQQARVPLAVTKWKTGKQCELDRKHIQRFIDMHRCRCPPCQHPETRSNPKYRCTLGREVIMCSGEAMRAPPWPGMAAGGLCAKLLPGMPGCMPGCCCP